MFESTIVDERDIFNFVFFSELLTEEKMTYLKKNVNNYEQLKFYKKLKKDMTKNISPGIREKLELKIPVYKIPRIIKLFPVIDYPEKKQSEVPILAAASSEQIPVINAQTFIDEEKGFVVRVLRYNESTKIYFFPVKNISAKVIQLTLLPVNKEYLVSDYNTPLEIENLPPVDSIEMEMI